MIISNCHHLDEIYYRIIPQYDKQEYYIFGGLEYYRIIGNFFINTTSNPVFQLSCLDIIIKSFRKDSILSNIII